MNDEWIKGQVNARDSLEDALAQSTRTVHFAVSMARTVGTLADAVQRVRELVARREADDDGRGPAAISVTELRRALDGRP